MGGYGGGALALWPPDLDTGSLGLPGHVGRSSPAWEGDNAVRPALGNHARIALWPSGATVALPVGLKHHKFNAGLLLGPRARMGVCAACAAMDDGRHETPSPEPIKRVKHGPTVGVVAASADDEAHGWF